MVKLSKAEKRLVALGVYAIGGLILSLYTDWIPSPAREIVSLSGLAIGLWFFVNFMTPRGARAETPEDIMQRFQPKGWDVKIEAKHFIERGYIGEDRKE